jgi:MOSC domain-containing protein YiiM
VKEKISTAEYAETAEHFLQKDQKHESFYENFILSGSSRLSAVCGSFLLFGKKVAFFVSQIRRKKKRMNEEEAESAEILF